MMDFFNPEHGEKKIRRRRRKAQHPPQGTVPGTLIAVPESPRPVVRLLQYGSEAFEERDVTEQLAGLKDCAGKFPVTWVAVEGFGDTAVLKTVGDMFELHQLSMEDVVHLYQRPKMEQYGSYLFIVARVPCVNEGRLEFSQFSLMLGSNFVVSFQEKPEPAVDIIRERIRQARGRIRSMQADYLAYALLDTIVDGYFPIIHEAVDRLEHLEDEVLSGRGVQVLREVHLIRRDFLALGKTVWPQRDVLHGLFRDPTPLIREETKTYFRDVYDHTIQITDFLESYREVCGDLMEVYLSSLNIRSQEVMKVLTIIATIFLPLSFIASLYGMNFSSSDAPLNMPELHWKYGYLFSLSLMAGTAIGFLVFFRRKGWLGTAKVTHDVKSRK